MFRQLSNTDHARLILARRLQARGPHTEGFQIPDAQDVGGDDNSHQGHISDVSASQAGPGDTETVPTGGSSSSLQPELHPTLSSNMYRDSPFGIPKLRDPLPLRPDGQPDFVQRLIKVRCVAVVQPLRLWRQVAPPHPSLNGVLSFFQIGSIVCACTDPCMADAECPTPAQAAFGRRVLAP